MSSPNTQSSRLKRPLWLVGLGVAVGLASVELQERAAAPVISETPIEERISAIVVAPETHSISVPSPVPSVHAATAIEMADGTLQAFWFGGAREGAKDVSIWGAIYGGSKWSTPRIAVSRDAVARGTGRYIRKLGNPVAVSAGDEVHLYVVSVSVGGWSGSALNRVVLDRDWNQVGPVQRLVGNPLLNLGTLIRAAPYALEGGDLVFPAYHEMVEKFPQLLRVTSDGRVVDRVSVPVDADLFQPWALTSAAGEVDLFLRRGADAVKEVHISRSRDDGETWSKADDIGLPNPNAGISAVRMDDGSILLAANPDEGNRSNLTLFRAAELTGPWKPVYEVDTKVREEDENNIAQIEYSYPWLMKTQDGAIHLFYTWNRTQIRHLQISQKALEGGGA
jgi:predicted neuraminidase